MSGVLSMRDIARTHFVQCATVSILQDTSLDANAHCAFPRLRRLLHHGRFPLPAVHIFRRVRDDSWTRWMRHSFFLCQGVAPLLLSSLTSSTVGS